MFPSHKICKDRETSNATTAQDQGTYSGGSKFNRTLSAKHLQKYGIVTTALHGFKCVLVHVIKSQSLIACLCTGSIYDLL